MVIVGHHPPEVAHLPLQIHYNCWDHNRLPHLSGLGAATTNPGKNWRASSAGVGTENTKKRLVCREWDLRQQNQTLQCWCHPAQSTSATSQRGGDN